MLKPFSYMRTKCLCIIAAIMALPYISDASEVSIAARRELAQNQARDIIILFVVLILSFAIMGIIKFVRNEKETAKLIMLGTSVSSVAMMVLIKFIYFA